MTDRKYIDDRRKRDDDVPIIGDFSAASDYGERPAPPPPAAPQPTTPPQGAQRPPNRANESWRLDPRDVARYARRAKGREQRGSFGTVLRFAAIALVVAAVGGVVYWNYEPLRSRAAEWLALARSPVDSPAIPGVDASRDDAEIVVVEPPVVAGTPELTAEDAGAARATAQTPAVTEAVPAVTEPTPAVTEPEAVVAVVPAVPVEPPAPETFEFAAQVVSVSERQAGAAAVVRRSGGNLGESSVVWWTSDGSATAGGDYANLDAIVERFAAGEKSRTIHVPIVGDSTAESRESFFVTLGEGAGAGEDVEPAQRVEIVIEDDD